MRKLPLADLADWQKAVQNSKSQSTLGQFHQYFCRQSRPGFVQIILDAFYVNSIGQNLAKIWYSFQGL
jgi:hypothetical protein